jgi:hypothetical protein
VEISLRDGIALPSLKRIHNRHFHLGGEEGQFLGYLPIESVFAEKVVRMIDAFHNCWFAEKDQSESVPGIIPRKRRVVLWRKAATESS